MKLKCFSCRTEIHLITVSSWQSAALSFNLNHLSSCPPVVFVPKLYRTTTCDVTSEIFSEGKVSVNRISCLQVLFCKVYIAVLFGGLVNSLLCSRTFRHCRIRCIVGKRSSCTTLSFLCRWKNPIWLICVSLSKDSCLRCSDGASVKECMWICLIGRQTWW